MGCLLSRYLGQGLFIRIAAKTLRLPVEKGIHNWSESSLMTAVNLILKEHHQNKRYHALQKESQW